MSCLLCRDCNADGIELQRPHKSFSAVFSGSTPVLGGFNGVGSDVYICGINGWVSSRTGLH